MNFIRTSTFFLAALTLFCYQTGYTRVDFHSPIRPYVFQRTVSTPSASSASPSGISPRVWALAQKAQSKAIQMGVAQKRTLTIIDYSLPSTQRRLWVIDMVNKKIIYHTHVAHGSGSGQVKANRFSDKPGSLQSSLGLFVTGSTYQGKHGLSLTLHGLEHGINANAQKRRIVVHGAHYVSEAMAKQGRLGRSWGCPAVATKLATPIINTIKNGSLVFAYFPDDTWMKRSKFL